MKFLSVLIVLGILIPVIGFARDKDGLNVQEKSPHNKNIDFYSEYSDLIKTLKSNGISVSNSFKNDVLRYLNSKKSFELIGFSPSSKGLRWNFYDVVFLRTDLIFVTYEDGEMYGGYLFLKIKILNNKVVSMETLWNSAGKQK